jgi:hypothetical protein
MVSQLRPGDLWSAVLGMFPSSPQFSLERARIPEYLASRNGYAAHYVLDYEDWDSVHLDDLSDTPPLPGEPEPLNPVVHVRVQQAYPLRVAVHEAFYASDHVTLSASCMMESHYPLYLDDMNW